MIKIIRSDEHYHSELDWLSSYWHFSFDHYHDPQKINFGPLRVFNDDVIQPGTGFGFHPHRDMEIVTYVIDGELEHQDNQGNRGIIHPGEIQRMTAGTGILHSEYNHSKEKPLRLLQLWIFANKRGLKPSWEQKQFGRKAREDKLLPVIVPENNPVCDGGALHIHQDASIYVSSLGKGRKIEHSLVPGRKAYFFVIDGDASLNNGMAVKTRDAALVEGESKLSIQANAPTELILLDLPEKYAANNNN
ncbi:MAG TPA: pirin family protein [Nitrososphaera sp.]|nr:pirin family protein [Nitrososphaera sp.]